jgi:hypothetical protein
MGLPKKKRSAQAHKTNPDKVYGFTYRLAFFAYYGITSVILNGKTKASWFDVAMTPDEESAKDGLRKEIKHAVEHGLRVW